jgi:hypothetical protein
MPSTVTPEVLDVAPNGKPEHDGDDAADLPQVPHDPQGPKIPLLAKLTSLTAIATVTAAGMMVIGALALVGGNYANDVVHDQLTPQNISFPSAGDPALLPGIKQYAGQQVTDGGQAKAYANDFIGVHLTKIARGKTYAEVSTRALAHPTSKKLAAQKASLFQGETLRGLLLNAWGWSVVATIATMAGFILLGLGAVLLLLPLANWQFNVRAARPAPAEVEPEVET